jgi:hypothetical protein
MKHLTLALLILVLGACSACSINGARRNDVGNNDGPPGDMTYRGGSM